MFAQQRYVFGCEALVSMEALLVPDIVAQIIVPIWRHTKSSVAVLPTEVCTVRDSVVDPFGSGGLDAVHQVAEGQSARLLDI
jgi:hypothetical protein